MKKLAMRSCNYRFLVLLAVTGAFLHRHRATPFAVVVESLRAAPSRRTYRHHHQAPSRRASFSPSTSLHGRSFSASSTGNSKGCLKLRLYLTRVNDVPESIAAHRRRISSYATSEVIFSSLFLTALSSASSSSNPLDDQGSSFRTSSSAPNSTILGELVGNHQPNALKVYHWTKPTLALAVPALIGMLADPILSLVDTAYVGRVGSLELAALGSCTSIFHLAFNAFRATTAATTSLVANLLPPEVATSSTQPVNINAPAVNGPITDDASVALLGSGASGITVEHNDGADDARQVSWLSLQLGFWMGVSVFVGLAAGGRFALACMGVPPDSPLFPPASEYLYARCWAAPVVLLITVSEGVFRGYGNTVVPLVASLTAAVMNLVLDPILMFRPVHWGVAGAAAATAISQCGAAAVYAWNLIRRDMLPRNVLSYLGVSPHPVPSSGRGARSDSTDGSLTINQQSSHHASSVVSNRSAVIRTILGANLSMMIKQGSLLLGWAFATARATRLGPMHVAAHQVALSVWLVFALILDGAAVASQVLMSRAVAADDPRQAKSLIAYMVKWALIQGGLSMLLLDGLDQAVPNIFTPDKSIQSLLHTIMPHLAAQQILVSLTLVVESLAAGANQFGILAVGTAVSTAAAVWQIGLQTSVDGIWSLGITTLFAGRLVTACVACWRAIRLGR